MQRLGSYLSRVGITQLSRSLSLKATPRASDSFLSGTNATALEQLYQNWEADPKSVDPTWQSFFSDVQASGSFEKFQQTAGGSSSDPESLKRTVYDTVRLMTLSRMYRVRGHLNANLDPLGLQTQPVLADLEPATYKLSEADMRRDFIAPPPLGQISDYDKYRVVQPAKAVEDIRQVYCGTVGIEYYHIHDAEQREWLQSKIEVPKTELSKEEKLWIYTHLSHAELFEGYLARKEKTAKRFGLEGGETCLPVLEKIVEAGSDAGIESICIGMPHRGRLNVLANTMKKPFRAIFQGFHKMSVDEWSKIHEQQEELASASDVQGSGDVKYHLGTTVDRTLSNGKKIHITLSPNPSHLEAVNPVVEGRTRAQQFYLGDTERSRVMSVLMHGDAAFAGQGVVAETLMFSDLKFYKTGGTIHIIVNNQIGFTTDTISARSTAYPSDIAKGAGAPIFHVNGDDPEAAVRVAKLAVEWRQRFKKSIVIDVVCYRKRGHNEGDEPSFTQPLMYKKIAEKESTRALYAKKLIAEGVATAEQLQQLDASFSEMLEKEFQAGKEYVHDPMEWIPKPWKDLAKEEPSQPTGVAEETLLAIGKHITTIPEGFNLHPQLKKSVIAQRQKMVETKQGIDWGMGEHLAYGSLLLEGHAVRLSGQDVERGTFSHRHAVWNDYDSPNLISKKYVPLDRMTQDQARFIIANSSLSEFGVLGFEYGTSLESPKHLAMWEAQFGDFANGAQVIFDQFISSGEAKWYTQSGVVVLLPHGYDGAGPEHSSCRLERFLNMSSEDPELAKPEWDEEKQLRQCNWQVLYMTTPANYFHAIRRQLKRNYRKPLIVAVSKSGLRLPASNLSDFLPGTGFQTVYPEMNQELVAPHKIRRVIFVTGQLYYDLVKARADYKINDVAIVRVEQLAPFPFAAVAREAAKYPNAQIAWAQEEPKNMGAWAHVRPRFETALNTSQPPMYIGRPVAASPATGWAQMHEKEKELLKRTAMTVA